MEYRFYVNRGRINIPEVTERFDVIELDPRESRLLQELIPLCYVPTAIFRGTMPKREMLSIARKLYNEGHHDVTVTDSERDKKYERIFMIK